MQEFAQTRNGQRYLNDVNRIAKALERLAAGVEQLVAKATESTSTSTKKEQSQ